MREDAVTSCGTTAPLLWTAVPPIHSPSSASGRFIAMQGCANSPSPNNALKNNQFIEDQGKRPFLLLYLTRIDKILGGMMKKKLLFGLMLLLMTVLFPHSHVLACGGFFCQNLPVDQAAERIIFTDNGDGTITTLIEIEYDGGAPDFSWILPIPSAISADDLAVPEDGAEAFDELHRFTDVRIIAPPQPDCAEQMLFDMPMSASVEEESGVEVFASGEVGPFGFDVIGSEDPAALIDWLRQHNYRVEPPMEPLIDVYVQEQFAFLAMRLLDGETSDSIKPIEITYESDKPMIPLRLTAVAATPGMGIFVWFFAANQVVPANYEHMEIANGEITFFSFGGNDYFNLIGRRADALGGRAFITEFAGAADQFDFANIYLQEQNDKQRYLTRLRTVIDPDEMTVDPVFDTDPQAQDVSNIRDMSNMVGLYDCERENAANGIINIQSSDAIETSAGSGLITEAPPENLDPDGSAPDSNVSGVVVGTAVGVLIGAAGAIAVLRARRKEG
ncbi:MAG: DUF2330 domain-containing protein [Chloroflexi bacterium]|nr:DUF2330 domain-containing protein [Chloroflexota bacterium]